MYAQGQCYVMALNLFMCFQQDAKHYNRIVEKTALLGVFIYSLVNHTEWLDRY